MPEVNLATLLCDEPIKRGWGDSPALREPKRAWSYGKLAEEAGRAGTALRALGIGPGDRVALLLHDSAELAASFIGAMRIGAVPVPVSVLSRPLDVRALLIDAAARAVLVNADLAQSVEPVRDEVPSLEHVLAIGGARPGQLDFHALTRDAEPVCRAYYPEPGDAAFLLYSAGPGGAQKGIAHDHRAAGHAHAAYAASLLELGHHDRVFITSSLSSAYGLGLGLLFPLLSGACTFLLPARPRPRTVFDVMATYKPTVFAAVPSLYGQMVHDFRELQTPRPELFSGVRYAISGGEPLPAALDRRVEATFGVQLLHGFGATEALHFVLSNRPGARREGSVGKPLPGIEARVVDDAGSPQRTQEIGSLEVRGPQVAHGYWRTGDHTSPSLRGVFHDGWVRTGDRFFVDPEGYYYHCGRADDLFKVSGRWVAPDEVERTLLLHPAVWECAVVEGHDQDGLARPVAFVVPNVGQQPSKELAAQLMEFVKRQIAPYKYPREIEFVDSLPKNASGKILRWRLRRSGQ